MLSSGGKQINHITRSALAPSLYPPTHPTYILTFSLYLLPTPQPSRPMPTHQLEEEQDDLFVHQRAAVNQQVALRLARHPRGHARPEHATPHQALAPPCVHGKK